MIKITQKLDGRQVEEGHIQILNTGWSVPI